MTAASVKTFGHVLDQHGGFGPGFDFARVFLAVNVLVWHSIFIATGTYGPLLESPAWICNYAILPMFFGLSGFLVAGSAQRLSLKNFAVNRGLRIFPALIVEISLSAFVLGPFFTSLALYEYFTDGLFYRYLLNIVALINYRLPGVFVENPVMFIVNGSLWTVPFEFICYFVMAALMLSGVVRSLKWLLLTTVAVIVVAGVVQAAISASDVRILDLLMDMYLHDGKGPVLLPCFMLGATAYVLRYRIPFDFRILIACLLVMLLVAIVFDADTWKGTSLVVLLTPFLIYVVCYVGLMEIPALPFFKNGDYSYGIYLYGFPIQQALVASSDYFRDPWLMLVSSFLLTTAFATVSWHFIEAPILKQRKKFSFSAAAHEARSKTATV